MARIPENEIERLKQEISLVRLAEGRGITLKQHGHDLIGLCPFHDDKEPSLVITPAKNLWHCLGACQTGGSVIDWVMKIEGVSFRHAVELLREGLPSLAASTSVVKKATVKKLPTPLRVDAEDQILLNQVMDYYHEELKQSPEALAYLEKRGIANAEAMDHFKLGFANRTLGYRLPDKNRKAGAELRGQLQRIGLYRDNGHEHFRGSLIIPVLDAQGNTVEVYGRKILDRLRKGTPKHLYLPGPHKGVFNLDALKASTEIILCESLIDALTFWCAGFRNVTASYGIEGFTKEHLQAFSDHNIERVLIAYDRDEAGNGAAEKLAKQLNKNNMDAYRIQFPKNMDANEYALQVQPASKSLGVVIRSAQWMGVGNPKARGTTIENRIEEPLPATPIPKAPPSIPVEVSNDDVKIKLGDRHYRIRGLKKNLSHEQLKVNILVSKDDSLHVDTFDLYAARPRAVYIKQAAVELGVTEEVIKTDLGKVLLQCEALQEQHIQQTLEPKPDVITLTDDDCNAALDLLKDKQLLQRILTDFSRCGVVGEETNKLVGYLACVSRKLDNPLAVMVQSSSAAGKSSLMEAILNLMPESDRVQYSAMTGQSLFYLGETHLKHRILAISEEEGAHNASYALKLLQSEGEVTIASTGKDDTTGDLVTKEYRVEGPVMLFMTTTAIDIDEELLNRCLVLSVNESREQTQAIHQAQRKSRTLEGLQNKLQKQQLTQLHRNAQQLLKPLQVINPYADQLTFLDDKTRTRRDHEKYLTLIDSIALLHQYQRSIQTITHDGQVMEYIEVQISDIEAANRLAHDVLGKTLDELPPQTRKLLKLIQQLVHAECKRQQIEQKEVRFSRKQIREYTGWGNTQIKVHCHRLEDMEYLLSHRGGRGQSFEYELLYTATEPENKQLMGLIDTEQLRYDAKKSGLKGTRSGSSRPQVGGVSGPGRTDKNAANAITIESTHDDVEEVPECSYTTSRTPKSYRNHRPALLGKEA